MSIVLQGSTSGSVTLQEPAVAGTTVLDLPATSGTVLTSASQSIPKAALPTGSVLQVVNATYSTEVTTSSSTFSDTGLSASITPISSSSKILILAQINGIYRDESGATYLAARLLRDSTNILNFEGIAAYISVTASGSTGVGGISATYLDSPSTTSSTTYKVQFASGANAAKIHVQTPASGLASASTITLMEIAA
jgi:hypothetical protein